MTDEAAKPHADRRRDRVLVVDDDPDARETIAVVLTQGGYAVDVANDGYDAIGKVSTAEPDLVLTDLQMPGMHGLDLIQNLRQIDTELPVVLATGVETRDLVTNAELYGAVACLEKPLDLDELFWTIDLALALRRGARIARAAGHGGRLGG
jgi:DNA-binding NtrC family response regulator